MLGHANYRMPVRGLYLCGAGAHPGGGVTGIPGHNAAREILARRAAPPWALTQPRAGASLGARVAALGVAQIVSWGTLFYSIAVLGAAMRAELGVSDALLFGAFSAGLFVSGAASPAVGRWIDARSRAAPRSRCGSCTAAFALALLAFAQGPATLIAGFLVAGAAMALTLYDPAFATLHVMSGALYRRAVTALTLFGGFASTVFWPLALALQQGFGWRTAFGVFAALHLVAVPAAALGRDPPRNAYVPSTPRSRRPPRSAPRHRQDRRRSRGSRRRSPPRRSSRRRCRRTRSACSLPPGSPRAEAVLAGSLIGPMQVAGRVVEFTGGTQRARAEPSARSPSR